MNSNIGIDGFDVKYLFRTFAKKLLKYEAKTKNLNAKG